MNIFTKLFGLTQPPRDCCKAKNIQKIFKFTYFYNQINCFIYPEVNKRFMTNFVLNGLFLRFCIQNIS